MIIVGAAMVTTGPATVDVRTTLLEHLLDAFHVSAEAGHLVSEGADRPKELGGLGKEIVEDLIVLGLQVLLAVDVCALAHFFNFTSHP